MKDRDLTDELQDLGVFIEDSAEPEVVAETEAPAKVADKVVPEGATYGDD